MDEVKKQILEKVRKNKIRHIQLWFTDILGRLKSMEISDSELEGALNDGIGFDGSSIEGFARIEESDVVAMPDPATFQILPWEPPEGPVARLICDVQDPYGNPYPGDPRYVLKKLLKKVAGMGYVYNIGPEMEYFYFKNAREPEVLDMSGYFDLMPPDLGTDLRRETAQALEAMGMKVECTHHEVAPSQHEVDLRHGDAMMMADNVMTLRFVTKEIARRNGVYATFMPKPILNENGSGMHVHQSLLKGDNNAFFDPKDEYNLSEIAKRFIAGLMKHADEIIAVTNQWVNSYKRLVPGYEAPVYNSWARRNRSAMIRVPLYQPGKEMVTRFEFRAPDPSCNPYLAFAVMLAAGLAGIEGNYELPAPIEENIFQMTPEEKERRGITLLPGNLYAAIREVSKSALVKETLGDHMFEKFVRNKEIEWDNYRIHVSRYELEKYLPIL
ncbi:MAG: glutamine synthetase family protein [Candidatus Euphemobacter frigidus]|nr:glutamine synthetase family protein [Candidatus Euphemobacter frigidus]MDP8275994.1 glutamine synthetase family protein [Candidatus Euphemobacter frigidus]